MITPDRYETIRRTMRHLRAQTVREQLEIVIVAPSADRLELDRAEVAEFAGIRVAEIGAISSLPLAEAVGVRAASAPIVAFTEDHCYPAPTWAEALIRAHRKPWAVVGPAIRNANPRSALSWANLLIEYGEWLDPAPAGTAKHLLGHNSAYKRAVLLDYGAELDAFLEAETVLHWDMRAKGHELCLEPEAKIYHENFSRLSPTIPLRFYGGRSFGATRSRRWSFLRRLLYIGGSPLIPWVRLYRVIRALLRPGRPRALIPRVLPALLLLLGCDAAGEACGYAFGIGDASQKLAEMDFHRERYMSDQDRKERKSQTFTIAAKDSACK